MSTDPTFINALDWQRVGGLLLTLWWMFASVIGLAGSILLAHGMVPSLAGTRDIPASAARMVRPPLYLSALFFLALLAVSVVMFVNRLPILGDIFDKGLA